MRVYDHAVGGSADTGAAALTKSALASGQHRGVPEEAAAASRSLQVTQ